MNKRTMFCAYSFISFVRPGSISFFAWRVHVPLLHYVPQGSQLVDVPWRIHTGTIAPSLFSKEKCHNIQMIKNYGEPSWDSVTPIMLCIFCCKPATTGRVLTGEVEHGWGKLEGVDVPKWFFQFVERSVSGAFIAPDRKRKREQLPVLPQGSEQRESQACADCSRIIETYCDLYHQQKVIELRLGWQMEKLWQVMKYADRVPSRLKAFREQCNDKDKEGNYYGDCFDIEKGLPTAIHNASPPSTREARTDAPKKPESLITFRSVFKKKCKRYRSKQFPRVQLDRYDCLRQVKIEHPEEKKPDTTSAIKLEKDPESMEGRLKEYLLLGWISSITAVIFLFHVDGPKSVNNSSHILIPRSPCSPNQEKDCLVGMQEDLEVSEVKIEETMLLGDSIESVGYGDECTVEEKLVYREPVEDADAGDERKEDEVILEKHVDAEVTTEKNNKSLEEIEMVDDLVTDNAAQYCEDWNYEVEGVSQKPVIVSNSAVESEIMISDDEPAVVERPGEDPEIMEISYEEFTMEPKPTTYDPCASLGYTADTVVSESTEVQLPEVAIVSAIEQETDSNSPVNPVDTQTAAVERGRRECVTLENAYTQREYPRENVNTFVVHNAVSDQMRESQREMELQNRNTVLNSPLANGWTQNHVKSNSMPYFGQTPPVSYLPAAENHNRYKVPIIRAATNGVFYPNNTSCSAGCSQCPPPPQQHYTRPYNSEGPAVSHSQSFPPPNSTRADVSYTPISALPFWRNSRPRLSLPTHFPSFSTVLKDQVLRRNALLQTLQYSRYNATTRPELSSRYQHNVPSYNRVNSNYNHVSWEPRPQQNQVYQPLLINQPNQHAYQVDQPSRINLPNQIYHQDTTPHNEETNHNSSSSVTEDRDLHNEIVNTPEDDQESPLEEQVQTEAGVDIKLNLGLHSTKASHGRYTDCCDAGAKARARCPRSLQWHQDYQHTNGQVALKNARMSYEISMSDFRLENFPGEKRLHRCCAEKCWKTFSLATELDRHSKIHHGDQTFTCHFCDLVISTSALDLIKHERDHSSDPPLQGDNNGVKTGGQKFVCGRCNVEAVSKVDLTNHYLQSHLGLPTIQATCPICLQTFDGVEEVHLSHYVNYHDLNRLDDPTKPFRCERSDCPAYFLTEDQLHTHWNKIHRTENISLESKISRMEKLKKSKELKALARNNHKCSHCLKSFSGGLSLRTHIWRWHGKGATLPQTGNEQGYLHKIVVSFPEDGITIEDIISDINTKHVCCIDNCNKGFLEAADLEKHSKLHGQFKCAFCEEVKLFAPELAIHEAIHKVSASGSTKNPGVRGDYCCARCSFTTNRKPDYVDHHLEKHLGLGNDRKRCPICRVAYPYEENDPKAFKYVILKHFQDYHDAEGARASTSENEGSQHQKVYPCDRDDCRAFFLKSVQMLEHVSEVHENIPWRIQEGRKCGDCGEMFRKSSLLRKHRLRKHNVCEANFTFVCDVPACSKRFETELERAQHFDFVHALGQEQFECTQENCDKKYWTKSGLLSHIRVSHGDKGSGATPDCHVCDECGKKFSSKFHVDIHKQFHAGPESWKFSCLICKKKIFSQQKLDEHMRVHTREKPFECKVCGVAYAHRHNLRIHVNNKHGLQDIAKKVNRVHTASSRKGKTYK